MTCPVKIRAWGKADGEFACRLADDGHREHIATGLFDYQTIHWYVGDRRCFTGDFTPCDQSTCILPAGHARGHS